MNILTKPAVAVELVRLYTAFPTHKGMKDNPDGTAAIYFEGLGGTSLEALQAATLIVIREDTYFPKIQRLREAAWEWTRRNRAVLEPQLADELWCPRCGRRCTSRRLWRPKMVEVGLKLRPELSDDGLYMALEEYQRLLCDCAVLPPFQPDEAWPDAAWMLVSAVSCRWGPPVAKRRPVTARAVVGWQTDETQRLLKAGETSEEGAP